MKVPHTAIPKGKKMTLCFFEGEKKKNHIDDSEWWETLDGGQVVEKREYCKQVTVDNEVYFSTRGIVKTRFNDYGIHECQGGCKSLGYKTHIRSKSCKRISRLSPEYLQKKNDDGGMTTATTGGGTEQHISTISKKKKESEKLILFKLISHTTIAGGKLTKGELVSTYS